jgi:nitrilase
VEGRAIVSFVRAAVAQVRAPHDTTEAIRKVREAVVGAADQGVDLVVFPEALLGGYPRGAGFGAVVGERSTVGRQEFLEYSRHAVTLPGPEIDELRSIAQGSSLHVVVGFIERVGQSLYCASVTIDSNGEVIGRRRKVMPTGSERLIWAEGDGSTLTVDRSRLGRLATAICWENLMPGLRLNFYSQGVDIWCAPTADARDVHLATMRHIAVEGRCFVLAANQFAQARDLSPSFATAYEDPEQVVCRGASVIVNPFGEVLAGPLTDGEGLLVADLDLDDITRGRYDFDASGHYSRSDLFTLVVDRRERHPVVPAAGMDGATKPGSHCPADTDPQKA